MASSILVAFANADGIGRRAMLEIRTTPEEGIAQDGVHGVRVTTTVFEGSVARAFEQAHRTLGSPLLPGGFRWSLRQMAGDRVPVGNPDGDSLYGGFEMVFLQLIARLEIQVPDYLRAQILVQLPAIRGTCLERVAISATPDAANGDFAKVGGIAQKLHRLAELAPFGIDCCVVARSQVPLPPGLVPPFPIVPAYDAVDAFCRLFAMQSAAVMGQVARYLL